MRAVVLFNSISILAMENIEYLMYDEYALGLVETFNRKNFHLVMEILEQLRYNVLIGV